MNGTKMETMKNFNTLPTLYHPKILVQNRFPKVFKNILKFIWIEIFNYDLWTMCT